MRRAFAGLGLLILLTPSARADCDGTAGAELMRGTLPIAADAPAAAKAAFALPYAAMIAFVPTTEAPPGFQRGPAALDLLTGGARTFATFIGFDAGIFVACEGRAVVIAFEGLRDFSIRDYVAGFLRRLGGGSSTLALEFGAAVQNAFPGYDVSVIGHSAGGNLASVVAGAYHLPSITFNASRTPAGFAENDGSRQLNVVVRGDLFADHQPPLPGMTLYVDVDRLRRHPLNVVIEGLEALLGS